MVNIIAGLDGRQIGEIVEEEQRALSRGIKEFKRIRKKVGDF